MYLPFWLAVQWLYYIYMSASGIKKKLSEVAKLSPFRKLSHWIKNICNHFHWTVSQTPPESQLRRDMWLSVWNHIQDIHVHQTETFVSCRHDPLPQQFEVDGVAYVRDYIRPGRLIAMILHTYLLLYAVEQIQLWKQSWQCAEKNWILFAKS